MSDVVVDSSVVAKWFAPEPNSVKARRLLKDVPAAGDRLVILDLAFAEVANAIWNKHRRKLMTRAEAEGSIANLLNSPLHAESAARLLKSAFEIAVKYDRAVYDAMFVALAHDLGIKGVTADEPLYNTTHADFPQIMLLRNWP